MLTTGKGREHRGRSVSTIVPEAAVSDIVVPVSTLVADALDAPKNIAYFRTSE